MGRGKLSSGKKRYQTGRGENEVDGRGRKVWGGKWGESAWKKGGKGEVKQGRGGRGWKGLG